MNIQKGLHGSASTDLNTELRLLHQRTQAERSPEMIEAALRNGCWIYGAGGYGRSIAHLLAARGIAPRGFIDRRAGDAALASCSLPVVDPGTLDEAEIASSTLLVAVHNFATDQLPIVRWARGAGFANVVLPADLPDVLGAEAGSYWLTGRGHLIDHLDAFGEAMEMMADPLSALVMRKIARFRISGEAEEHPASTIADQYFPTDISFGTDKLRLIDGGAYIGDALEAAERAGLRIEQWYAFEPDPSNYAKLVATVRRSAVAHAALFPCGLGDRLMQLRFATGSADGSRATEGGDSLIQIVALDEALPAVDANFIKLDIEGAEAAALDGMAETLRRNRPRVAMSIYHKPADLWELPLKLAGMLPGAKLYVRQHGFNGFDTVLYAVT